MPSRTLKPASKSSAVAVIAKPKAIDLDKLDAVQIRNGCEFDTDSLGKRAVAMVTHIEGLKTERSKKAILAGLYLAQVRASLDHGEFGPWKEKHFGSARSRTVNHYMALAAKFARSSRLTLPEMIGGNQLTIDLQPQDGDGRALNTKLDKFVGNRGLTELMHRHDVIKQGGARAKPQPKAIGGADDGADEPTLDEAEAAARAAGLDTVETASKALLKEELWHDLTPDNASLIDTKLKALADKFHERLLKLKHAHKA